MNDQSLILQSLVLGEGFYCGAVFIVTGVVQLASKKPKLDKLKFALNIFSGVAAGWMLLVSGSILIGSLVHFRFLPPIIIHSFLVIFSIFELFTNIYIASFSCYRQGTLYISTVFINFIQISQYRVSQFICFLRS